MNQVLSEDKPSSDLASKAETVLAFMDQAIKKSIKRYQKSYTFYRRFSKYARWTTIVVPAIIVALFLPSLPELDPPGVIIKIALSLGAVTALLAAIIAFFDFRKLTFYAEETVKKLLALDAKVQQLKTNLNAVTSEELDAIRDEYIKILHQTFASFMEAKQAMEDS